MAINIGSVIALFISPVISSKFGFSASFIMSGIGILLAIVSFYTIRNDIKHVSTNAGMQALNLKKLFLVILGAALCSLLTAFLLKKVNYAQLFLVTMVIIVTIFYLRIVVKNRSIVRRRMVLGLILMFEAVFFQILYGQMQTSINFFAINNVSPSILGFSINPQSFQSLNPFWIIVLSPLLSYFYVKLGNKGLIYSIHNKFATGMLLCGLSFVSLFISKYFANELGIVNSLWLVLSYGLGGAGELMISALGVAMVAELVPGVMSGFVMGMWFSYLSIGNLLSGYVASLVALPKITPSKWASLSLYTGTFLKIGIIAIIISLVMFSLSRYKNSLWTKNEQT
jgi:POT family proton-dependent oligopeptide transporter